MSEALTVREKIFVNLQESLQEITKENSFNNTLKEVKRPSSNDESYPDFPGIVLYAGTQNAEIQALSSPQMKSNILNVVLELWIRQDPEDTTPSDTILNSILGDVEKKLLEDRTRGGNALDTVVATDILPFPKQIGASEAGYLVTVNIEYRYQVTDPTVAI